jgi:hypothetical protein
MDACSQWYIAKRDSLLRFWILGNLMLSILAFVVSWKFGIGWLAFATLVFIAAEKLLLRRVDVAAPR